LVVIDPLFRFAQVKDEKAYAETYNALGPLIDLARETGTHLMLTHHSGKLPPLDPTDAPLGSTGLGAAPATLIYLKKWGNYRTICTVQRIGENLPDSILLFDKTTRGLKHGGTKEEVEQHDAEQRILAFMEGLDAQVPQTQTQIKEGVEGSTKVVWAALTNLLKEGRLTRTGKGVKGSPHMYSLWSWPPPKNADQETRGLF
jgi:hypothetical protein